MAGNLIARAIVEGDQTWREFSPFELVWAGGIAARAGVQIRNWIKRYRDRIDSAAPKRANSRTSQAREAEKLRAESRRRQNGSSEARRKLPR